MAGQTSWRWPFRCQISNVEKIPPIGTQQRHIFGLPVSSSSRKSPTLNKVFGKRDSIGWEFNSAYAHLGASSGEADPTDQLICVWIPPYRTIMASDAFLDKMQHRQNYQNFWYSDLTQTMSNDLGCKCIFVSTTEVFFRFSLKCMCLFSFRLV